MSNPKIASFRLVPLNLTAPQHTVIDLIKKTSIAQTKKNFPIITREQVEESLKNAEVGKIIEAYLDTLATNQRARNMVIVQLDDINNQLATLTNALNTIEVENPNAIEEQIATLNENKKKLKAIQNELEAEIKKYDDFMHLSKKQVEEALRNYTTQLAEELKTKYSVQLSKETVQDVVDLKKTLKQVVADLNISI